MDKKLLIKVIRETLVESKIFEIIDKKDSDSMDEERIINPRAKEFVKQRKNFIGSHIFGEDLGGLGIAYVAYSYGEQFPAYLYINKKWFHNYDDYALEDGTTNPATEKHKKDMEPEKGTIGISTKQIQSMISAFKKEHGIPEISHTSVEPGEKN